MKEVSSHQEVTYHIVSESVQRLLCCSYLKQKIIMPQLHQPEDYWNKSFNWPKHVKHQVIKSKQKEIDSHDINISSAWFEVSWIEVALNEE